MTKRMLLVVFSLSSLWMLISIACVLTSSPEVPPTKPPSTFPTILSTATTVPLSSQLPSTVSASPTMTEQLSTVQEKAMVDFILRQLAVKGTRMHFIAQVAPVDEYTSRPIDVTHVLFLQCWTHQQEQFNSCDKNTFLKNLDKDKQNPPWQYSYAIFYIAFVDDDYTTATVRLDYFTGPKASSGALITLKKTNEQWEVESQKPVWVS